MFSGEPLTPAFSATEPIKIYERASIFCSNARTWNARCFNPTQCRIASRVDKRPRRVGQKAVARWERLWAAAPFTTAGYFSLWNVRSLKTAAICLFIFFMCISPRPLQTQSRCKHQTKDTCNRCLRLARSLRAIPARVAPTQAENLRRSNCKALSCIDTYARPERARLEALILHSAALHIT